MDIKEDLLLWFINFFDKKSTSLTDKSVSGSGIDNNNTDNKNNEIKQNIQLEELHKPVIRKF